MLLQACLTLALVHLPAPQKATDTFTFVKNGQPTATIAVSSEADAPSKRAAQILQDAIKRISGVDIPIAVRVVPGLSGEVDLGYYQDLTRKPLTRDGFAIGLSGKNLAVQSGGGKGSIYAVVHMLEKYFGCRYFSPTFQEFPQRKTVAIKQFLDVDNPANEFRAVNGDFARDQDYMDWNRLDRTDELFGNGFYVHTFRRLVPPELYYGRHPEYFALTEGRRNADQLCPSRPENVEIAVAKLKEEMAAQPGKRVWSVSQNDNSSYCHCPDCTRIMQEDGSPSGPILRFVNAIAKRFPEKTISTLAYLYSRQAPAVTRPEPNVQIMLCTIELNRGEPIATDRTSFPFRKDIIDWGKICQNIYLWDYTVNFSHQVSPFPNLHTLQSNIQFFMDHNVRQHFQQTNTSPGHEFSELKGYVEARLLWNPKLDFKATIADFLKGYYGAAAPFIEKYIDTLEAAQRRSKTRLDIYERPIAHSGDYLSASNMTAYNTLFDKAEAVVLNQPDVLERVRTARLPLQYATISIGCDDMFGPRGFFKDRPNGPALRPEMKRTLETFNTTCNINHVRSVNEANLSPTEFYQAALRMTDLQMEGNIGFRKPIQALPPPSEKYGDGNVKLLTNGVQGASDFGVQWLGWEGADFTLVLDLETKMNVHEASINTISVGRSWILHPIGITCSVSDDAVNYRPCGTILVEGDQEHEDLIKSFKFTLTGQARFVRMQVVGTKKLPGWHPSAGGQSWVFADEFVVR